MFWWVLCCESHSLSELGQNKTRSIPTLRLSVQAIGRLESIPISKLSVQAIELTLPHLQVECTSHRLDLVPLKVESMSHTETWSIPTFRVSVQATERWDLFPPSGCVWATQRLGLSPTSSWVCKPYKNQGYSLLQVYDNNYPLPSGWKYKP